MYERDHIPGAVYFDLERDLSGPATGRGGRHPLPDMEEFCALLGRRGVGGVTVVCYDDQLGQMAARLWWMLRYVGHDDAAVLDGGYGAWREAGGPVTAEVPAPTPRTFVAGLRPQMLAGMDGATHVAPGAGRGATGRLGGGIIIDSRAPERYRGEVEPFDPVVGHIPGARNLPWMDNVDPRAFRPREELRNRLETSLRTWREWCFTAVRRFRLRQLAGPGARRPPRRQVVCGRLERVVLGGGQSRGRGRRTRLT